MHPDRRAQPPVRFKRAPTRRRAAPRRGASSCTQHTEAAALVADMTAAGARFCIITNADRTDFRYSYRLADGADPHRVALLVAKAQADRELLALVRVAAFAAIAREALDLPARSA